jgi:tol-pal system-associated acyl-CoA thioesterase
LWGGDDLLPTQGDVPVSADSVPGYVHTVQVYYEDTDHSGVVYHANYLKYFERAREHLLGVDELVRLQTEDGLGFVVYKVEVTYRDGAVFGDTLRIETRIEQESAFRVLFHQNALRDGTARPLVEGVIHLVCVDRDRKLVPLPESVLSRLQTP